MSINMGYFVRESVQNFRRNWVMSLGAVITIYLSLLLVGVFIATGFVVNSVVQSVEDKVTVQIFLKDGAATEDVNALQAALLKDPLVKGVDYTSKDDALKKFKEDMKQSPEIIDQLEGNPLPASLDVTLKEPKTVEQMVAKIKKMPLFLTVADRPDSPEESLKYGQQIVNKLFAFTRVIRVIEVVFVLMLGIVSLIFINNTIRLAIYARRKEIGIMRLVGASNWFIRTPFLLEGVLQALIGASLAILSVIGLQAAIMPRLRDALPFLAVTLSGGATAQIALSLILAGVFIGIGGSWLAMTRYLKV
ncbi:MAG: ABC transporter permease [Actinobacteria bacterium HGW-Actinobacteria-7]|nr:MAG: ABC transporter permease [Actinobacteria bacterium HGW-Actinobacteria-7]